MIWRQRLVVHLQNQQRIVKCLPDWDRSAHVPIVNAARNDGRVQPRRHNVDGSTTYPRALEHLSEWHASPPGYANGTEPPLCAGRRRALLRSKEAPPVASALDARDDLTLGKPSQLVIGECPARALQAAAEDFQL